MLEQAEHSGKGRVKSALRLTNNLSSRIEYGTHYEQYKGPQVKTQEIVEEDNSSMDLSLKP
jgi:hypothetical protein